MKIIAVNISRNVKEFEVLEATERAWKLNLARTKNYDFVIGVSNGKVVDGDSKVYGAYFKLINVKAIEDLIHNDRVKFMLKRCNDSEIDEIQNFLNDGLGKGLSYFTTKYF